MKFSIAVTTGKDPLMGIERGLKASLLGYHGAYSFDHLFYQYPSPQANQLECWTTISTIAAKTEKFRIGSLVLSVILRHPALVAKMASSLDNISNGRLTLGLGAGWYKPEYTANGIPFLPYQTRMEQLEETIQILRLLWSEKETTFKGKHFTIDQAPSNPKPIQEPLPILIGGNNENQLLTLAAKYADNYNALWVSPKDCRRKFQILTEKEKAFKRNKGSITRSFYTNIYLTSSSEQTEALVNNQWSEKTGKTKDEWVNSRILGTPDQVIKQVEAYKKAGVGELILIFSDQQHDFTEMMQFSRDIMPSF